MKKYRTFQDCARVYVKVPHSYVNRQFENNKQIIPEIKFQDLNGKFIKESFSGISARVLQHEYDHIEGVLFTDKLSYLKKKTIKRKLTEISAGKIKVDYSMKFL